ncbi:DUF2993 domain-containing protein [Streptomyces sp. Ru73]|uniref:LmeA family phospholipid-binding protein n=1 Tax=Streptomyces sp. Ru73 TaxID=2080748 RepID=UPI000CDE3932|nr:DUF2993 domain-containing protein [Streptomyces sp. Ru73]POX41306.1 DUF2993 domain-containing protein [Streptomyces sp. Ru73]
MRPPTRISASPAPQDAREAAEPRASEAAPGGPGDTREFAPVNPYAELAGLADPEPDLGPARRHLDARDDSDDPLGLGLRPDTEDDDAWSPPNHRKSRRGRGWFAAVPLAAKLVATVLVAASFAGLADRFAVLYAQNKAAEKLKDSLHLAADPEVDIEGFPFLTQVADKRLDRVRVTIPDLAADRVSLAKFEATAEDVTLDGDLPTSLKGGTVGRMHGDVLLSFEDMNRELGASQVKFSELGPDAVRAEGGLPIAGHELRMHATARIRQAGDRGISTEISGMRLDIGDIAVYRPGTGKGEGLQLTRKTARRLSQEAAKIKAMLGVPAIADRIGIPPATIDAALHNEQKLHDLIGTPRFIGKLMKVNLVDVVADHPWLLRKVGIDPKILGGLAGLTKPEIADRFDLSFRLPATPGDVRLRTISVERDGIRARLSGKDLPFGDTAKNGQR